MSMPSSKISGKTVAVIVLLLGIVVLVVAAVRFIQHRSAYAATDAVFVRTDSLTDLGFDRVSGRLLEIRVKEGDAVEQGGIIAAIDDTTNRLEVERLQAEIGAEESSLEGMKLLLDRLGKEVALNEKIASSQVEHLQKQKEALMAKAAGQQAIIDQLQRDRDRFETLFQAKAVAKRRAEDVATDLTSRQEERKAVLEEAAAVKASRESASLGVQLAEARRIQIGETEKTLQAQTEKIKGLRAALANAESDLAACILRSPMTGRVAKRFVSPGDILTPKKTVCSLVDPADIHIMALLEENKIEGIAAGAPAEITIDAYPDQKFRGKVSGILPASAATFALAPRDISAGEFTKVAQRIPVRIDLTEGDRSLLRIGMGGEVEIRRMQKKEK